MNTKMRFLEPSTVIELNRRVIEFAGGAKGAINEANLSFICDRAQTISKRTTRVAAFYFHSFAASGHVFTDGNKRTAHAVLEAFLLSNERTLKVNDEEFVGFALLTASGNKTLSEVEAWIKARVIRVKNVKR